MLLTDKYWTFSVRILCLLVMHMNDVQLDVMQGIVT